MAKRKTSELSKLEIFYIKEMSGKGIAVEQIAKDLNRTIGAVNQYYPTKPVPHVDNTPDPPKEVLKGEAKEVFKSSVGNRKGLAVMSEAGSEIGDRFLKINVSDLAPMSSKHKNCIVKAQNE